MNARFGSVSLLLLLLLHGVNAMYQDEAGVKDWVRHHVGAPREVAFEGKGAVVLTEEEVLARIALRSGHIRWRIVFDEGT